MVSTHETPDPASTPGRDGQKHDGGNAAQVRPTAAQRRYLERGLGEPGGKLPLFDREGREVPRKTIEACIGHGWAEPWTPNPVKPDWLVCRLTAAGRQVLAEHPPAPSPQDGDVI